MKPGFLVNQRDESWRSVRPGSEVRSFHQLQPDYSSSPLIELPEVAKSLGVARVFTKNESLRLGLPAFKALGASWAVNRAIEQFGSDITLVTATDGNHGRAIARFSKQRGLRSVIFVPRGVHPVAVTAIRQEGAEVIELDDDYDSAVQAAAKYATEPKRVLIQDTSWFGYEEIPNWIVEGYDTLFTELDEQLSQNSVTGKWSIAVPTGVGSLLQAALNHYRADNLSDQVSVFSVEPEAAACVAESLLANQCLTIETGLTIMTGLNCGTPSYNAWPIIQKGLDAAVVISDSQAEKALRELRRLNIDAGPCAASGLAAFELLMGSVEARDQFGLGTDSVLVILLTEGAAANPF